MGGGAVIHGPSVGNPSEGAAQSLAVLQLFFNHATVPPPSPRSAPGAWPLGGRGLARRLEVG